MLTRLTQFLACAAGDHCCRDFLSKYADALAEMTDVGRLLISSVLLAGAASLPELTVDISVAALRMGAHDLVISNVFGSNAFNMALLASLDVVHPGPLLGSVSHSRAILVWRQF